MQPIPVFLPGKFHGQRSLAGYSPWGREELDMTLTKPQPQHTIKMNISATLCNTLKDY